ncbi:MAG: DUF4399 domain-containing protein [Gemmatimonadetes bacterium]|nr:DUF4399 domain-containing protein [Gemmatimonadota bacterium]
MRRLSSPFSIACVGLLVACAGSDQAEVEPDSEPEASAAPGVTVRIVSPEEGATVGPDVTVVLETEGIEIVSITPPVPGTGHHHLYVDVDLTPLDQMIPQGDPQIIHKGDGSSEHTIEGLAPGPHRIIALVANPAHIPLDPPAADTVNFTVGN